MRRDPYGNQLLVRMHYKHGQYWYVYRNKWRPIGKNYEAAYREYGEIRFAGDGSMLALIKKTYERYELKAETGELRASSLAAYRAVRANLLVSFQNMDADSVKPSHIRRMISHYYPKSPAVGNRVLVVLREAFELGMELGLCETNPARMVKGTKQKARKRRLTEAEFRRIQTVAPEYLKVMMEVLYCTAQRIGDVLAIRQADITPDGMQMTQIKTGHPLMIQCSPRLEKAIRKARSGPVVGQWLFTRYGKPYPYSTVHSAFKTACEKARVEGATIHDIRAMAITDASLMGRDAQKLAGHTDAKMTDIYIRERVVDKVESL